MPDAVGTGSRTSKMRSLHQFRFEYLACLELGQLFKCDFSATDFSRFRRLREALNGCCERKRQRENVHWLVSLAWNRLVEIRILYRERDVKIEDTRFVSGFISWSAANLRE